MNQYQRARGGMTLWDLLFLIGLWVGSFVAIGFVAKVAWTMLMIGWGLL